MYLSLKPTISIFQSSQRNWRRYQPKKYFYLQFNLRKLFFVVHFCVKFTKENWSFLWYREEYGCFKIWFSYLIETNTEFVFWNEQISVIIFSFRYSSMCRRSFVHFWHKMNEIVPLKGHEIACKKLSPKMLHTVPTPKFIVFWEEKGSHEQVIISFCMSFKMSKRWFIIRCFCFSPSFRPLFAAKKNGAQW